MPAPKWPGAHLTEAASAAGRTKDIYLSTQYYQRLRGRRGVAKATKQSATRSWWPPITSWTVGSPTTTWALTGLFAPDRSRR